MAFANSIRRSSSAQRRRAWASAAGTVSASTTGGCALTTDTIVGAYRDSTAFPAYLTSWLVRYDTIVGAYYETTLRLRAAGVTLLLGTDAGNFGTIHGWSVHRELERFVEAGDRTGSGCSLSG